MSERLAFDYAGAADSVGVSIDTIKREVAAGNIAVRYYGRKPLIPATSLAAWFKALPAEPKKKSAVARK
jgi:hypothetical protein